MHRRIYSFPGILVVFAILVTAQGFPAPLFTSDNKVECVNKMVDWCENMQYPKEGTGMAMASVTVRDESGKFWRVFCSSDSDGTNCTRNASPWFSCSPDHQLTYKGTQLKKESTDGVDDGICNTTKMAFNDIFIQNLSFNSNMSTEMTKGMESFFEMLAELQEQFDLLRSHIFSDCFPFCPPNSSDDGNPFDGKDSATESPDSTATGQSNQLERE